MALERSSVLMETNTKENSNMTYLMVMEHMSTKMERNTKERIRAEKDTAMVSTPTRMATPLRASASRES